MRNEKKDTGNNQISECAIEKVRWQTLMGFFKGKYSYQLTFGRSERKYFSWQTNVCYYRNNVYNNQRGFVCNLFRDYFA